MAKLTIKEVERRVMEAMQPPTAPQQAANPNTNPMQMLLQRVQNLKQGQIK